jgi:hypothetical protein
MPSWTSFADKEALSLSFSITGRVYSSSKDYLGNCIFLDLPGFRLENL